MLIVAIGAVAVVIVGVAWAQKALYANFLELGARSKAAAGAQADAVVTEEDLGNLPEPMARYMRFSGVLGKKRISSAHIIHSGQFKPSAKLGWKRVDGEYFITTRQP